MFLYVNSRSHLATFGSKDYFCSVKTSYLSSSTKSHVLAHTHPPGKLKINANFLQCSSSGYDRSKDLFQHVSPPALCHQKSSTTQIRLVIQTGKTITLVSSNSLWSLSALVFSKSRLCSSSLMRACSSLVCVC